MLDIFKSNAFSVVSLTDAINNLKFVPGRIGQLGLFSSTSIATTSVAIEQKNGVLSLVAPTPRGGPGITVDKSKRSLLDIRVPHFEINDAVMAEQVQGIRAFGSESALESIMDKINEQLMVHVQSHAATEEYARVGAIKGIITYADGSTLNLFTTFGVAQPAEINFALATNNGGALRKLCAGVYRQLADALDGIPFVGVRGECGDNFFDDLLSNEEVRASYLQQQEAKELRAGYVDGGSNGAYGSFDFGSITWENYRGKVGGTSYVNTDKCHLFPIGAPGLFRTVYAPADYVETVNTLGKPIYAKQYPMDNDKGINLDTQKNALQYCTRPQVLIQGKRA